jgi:hypothetical protein
MNGKKSQISAHSQTFQRNLVRTKNLDYYFRNKPNKNQPIQLVHPPPTQEANEKLKAQQARSRK